MTVDLEEEQDPPSFKAARKKDKERLQKVICLTSFIVSRLIDTYTVTHTTKSLRRRTNHNIPTAALTIFRRAVLSIV